MEGKETCRILGQIRAEIARQNDIALRVEPCAHRGPCRGTCPRCESEVRDLERQLEKRRALKKAVALAGVCAGMSMALSGGAAVEAGVKAAEQFLDARLPAQEDVLMGMVAPAGTGAPEAGGGFQLEGELALVSERESAFPAGEPAPAPEREKAFPAGEPASAPEREK